MTDCKAIWCTKIGVEELKCPAQSPELIFFLLLWLKGQSLTATLQILIESLLRRVEIIKINLKCTYTVGVMIRCPKTADHLLITSEH